MKTTCQSEVGKIKSVLLKKAADAFVDENHLRAQWKELHFLETPELGAATREFESFEALLKRNGTIFYHLPQDDKVTIDSLYCRDAAIATDHGMILCNMGKASRVNEPEAQHRLFTKNGISVLGQIQATGTIEGGDCAWMDRKTLAVGESYRTNQEGIRQLKQMLLSFGVEVLVVSLPHYKGPSDVFHLMSVFSPVDHDLAAVYSPLMPIAFRNELIRRGYQLVEVPEGEFESMGCNVLALAPRECVMLKGNPETKRRLEKTGCRVSEYEGWEISLKGGGGPTCLTRPIERYV